MSRSHVLLAFLALAVLLAPVAVAQPKAKAKQIKQGAGLERVAGNSKALRAFLERPENARRLLSDPEVKKALARDPQLKALLARNPAAIWDDPAISKRLLAQDSVKQFVLQDPVARGEIETELATFQVRVVDGEKAARRGEHQLAVQQFEMAAQEADRLGNSVARASAMLNQARALEKVDDDAAALELYDVVANIGDSRQQALAHNNKGVALLRTDRPRDAVAALRAIDLQTVEAEERPYFRFNLARAYEKNGNTERALAEYREALASKPDFRAAADGVFRILRRGGAEKLGDAVAAGKKLVESGQPRLAAVQTRRSLDTWRNEPDAPLLCRALIESYAAAGLTREAYVRKEQAELHRMGEDAKVVEKLTTALDKAFEGEVTLDADTSAFPIWSSEETGAAWSKLLKQAADSFDNRGDLAQALARYVKSWELDHDNTEALVHIAEMMQREDLRNQHPRIFAELKDRVIAAKGEQYLVPHKSEQDWLLLLRYHILLGTIFEQEGNLGSEQEIFSAIGQYRLGLNADERVRALNSEFGPSPGLYFRMAEALMAQEAPTEEDRKYAGELYAEADRGFLAYGDEEGARHARDAAARLR